MRKLGPMWMRHVRNNGSGGAFATTQGAVRPIGARTLALELFQKALAAARLARGGCALGYGRDGDYGSLDTAEEAGR